MRLAGKRILVTGAGGFIGSHLTERLVELGATTRALVHYRSNGSWGWLDRSSHKSDIEIVSGDIRDRDCVLSVMRGVDVVTGDRLQAGARRVHVSEAYRRYIHLPGIGSADGWTEPNAVLRS